MSLVLNEDQLMLRESARSFCQDRAPVSVLRQVRDDGLKEGFPQDLWREIVELGWAGMAIPEQYGGFDFGYSGLGVVLEEMGRTLAPSPLFSTVVLGATAISLGGDEAQKSKWLPTIASGELLMPLAVEEGPLHRPEFISCSLQRTDEGLVLNGEKKFVLDGQTADYFIVVARSEGAAGDVDGVSLVVVDANAAGVEIQSLAMVDSRAAAHVRFNNVATSDFMLLGAEGRARDALEQTLDVGRIMLAAEMLGGIREVFERTVEYLKQREQFGVKIGAFQALQHRAALMYSEIQLCESLVRKALYELDQSVNGAQISTLASMCKAKLSEVYMLVSNEGIQLHGGIGMTDEFDIGFYLKRARVAQQLLGDAAWHRDRYATLRGF